MWYDHIVRSKNLNNLIKKKNEVFIKAKVTAWYYITEERINKMIQDKTDLIYKYK